LSEISSARSALVGSIEVDSRVGEFTEFTVRLPRLRGRREAYRMA
jgi:hypothetical protein